MNQLEKLQDFYQNGTDPEFSPNPNHIFGSNASTSSTFLMPGHFYTHLELEPIGPDQVPTWDEYEMMKNPSTREDSLIEKYPKVKKPFYDNRPIFLALSTDGFGLNIKLMSQPLRKKFIRMYLKQVATLLDRCYSDGTLIDIEKRLRMSELSPFYRVNLDFIKAVSGLPDIKFNLLVNKYNREKMRNLSLIDWNDVPKLHLANYSTDKMISARSSFSLFEIK
jgi:hypothetical protein